MSVPRTARKSEQLYAIGKWSHSSLPHAQVITSVERERFGAASKR
jgi:hypothetical protein